MDLSTTAESEVVFSCTVHRLSVTAGFGCTRNATLGYPPDSTFWSDVGTAANVCRQSKVLYKC